MMVSKAEPWLVTKTSLVVVSTSLNTTSAAAPPPHDPVLEDGAVGDVVPVKRPPGSVTGMAVMSQTLHALTHIPFCGVMLTAQVKPHDVPSQVGIPSCGAG